MKKEAILHRQVCDYLRKQYPDVLFTSEASGLRLTMGQAVQMKRLRSCNGFPDLMIFEPRRINNRECFGLFLELKAEGTKLLNSEGYYATPHLREQRNLLDKLSLRCYFAEFAVGFDEAKRIIDEYLT
jgi:hypothetical protein